MERHWFVTIDVARLRGALHGPVARAASEALAPAAVGANVRIVDSCVVNCGVRAVIAARSAARLRIFVRRFTACCGRPELRWRTHYRAAPLTTESTANARAQLQRMRDAARASSEGTMITRSAKSVGAAATRRLASLLRHVDRQMDGALGAEAMAGRIRRYVGEHDAPADDRAAFARLCTVVFAQGIGYDAVLARADALRAAFGDFDPTAVSAFDAKHEAALLELPIIRNAAKIRACVENAKRWCALAATHGSYLGRIASVAATDDPTPGWPGLTDVVAGDFVRLGESTARQTLKRWGFFTAFAHPGVRRTVERLGYVEEATESAAVQRLIGAVAHRLGRDPYAVEAVLALFAGAGPCKKTPACNDCSLAERCPSAATSS